MNALQREYGPRGVQLVAINSNDPHLYPDESHPADGRSARPTTATRSRTWPTTASASQRRMARRARSTSSCSTATRRLRYQGRFDDSRHRGQRHAATTCATRSTTCSPGGTSGSRRPDRSAAASTTSRARPMTARPRLPAASASRVIGSRRSSPPPWAVVARRATLTGVGAALHHHALIEGGPPLPIATGCSSSAGS